jgi:hypothetical protein
MVTKACVVSDDYVGTRLFLLILGTYYGLIFSECSRITVAFQFTILERGKKNAIHSCSLIGALSQLGPSPTLEALSSL